MKLGTLYQISGHYDEALGKLNKARRLNPQNLQAQKLMGIIFERKGMSQMVNRRSRSS